MGGPDVIGYLDALGASFEAGVARDEDVAAADLAFSLRQDVATAAALARSGTGWSLIVDREGVVDVEELGADYVLAGPLLVPLHRIVVRSTSRTPPRVSDRSLLEVLGEAARAGASAEIVAGHSSVSGALARVTRDHLAVAGQGTETIVSLGLVERVRIGGRNGYSPSRGLSG